MNKLNTPFGDISVTVDGTRVSDVYDYDVDYLRNGMAYLIAKNTKTTKYVLGIAWIEKKMQTLGITKKVNGITVKIYDKERMLIELLRNNNDSHGTINGALHQLAATVLV